MEVEGEVLAFARETQDRHAMAGNGNHNIMISSAGQQQQLQLLTESAAAAAKRAMTAEAKRSFMLIDDVLCVLMLYLLLSKNYGNE